MKDKARYYKSIFLTYFDGCYDVEPEINTPSTYAMGICKLEYIEKSDTLMIHLRRPGFLIGKGGTTINKLKKYMECKLEIIEVNLNK